jgi:hypothetical protein
MDPTHTHTHTRMLTLLSSWTQHDSSRGSGIERGHGEELPLCPKCGVALEPGQHHYGCSARGSKYIIGNSAEKGPAAAAALQGSGSGSGYGLVPEAAEAKGLDWRRFRPVGAGLGRACSVGLWHMPLQPCVFMVYPLLSFLL